MQVIVNNNNNNASFRNKKKQSINKLNFTPYRIIIIIIMQVLEIRKNNP